MCKLRLIYTATPVWSRWKYVILTSNHELSTWYPRASADDLEALKRRLPESRVVHKTEAYAPPVPDEPVEEEELFYIDIDLY